MLASVFFIGFAFAGTDRHIEPSCQVLLTPAIRARLTELYGAGPRDLSATAVYPVRVEQAASRMDSFTESFEALLVVPPHIEPLVLIERNGVREIEPWGPRPWRLTTASRTVGHGRDGAWRFDSHYTPFGETALKPFVETHEGAVRQMLAAGYSEGSIRGASVTPFDWGGENAWLLGIVRNSATEYLFFTDDPNRYWTADVLMANFVPNHHYLKAGDSLLFKSAPGKIPHQPNEIVELDVDWLDWIKPEDEGVARMIELNRELVEQLMVGGHLIQAFKDNAVTSAQVVDVEDTNRSYMLLGSTSPHFSRFEAVVSESSDQERLQIHFAHPRTLRTEEGHLFRASFADGRWTVKSVEDGDEYSRLRRALSTPLR